VSLFEDLYDHGVASTKRKAGQLTSVGVLGLYSAGHQVQAAAAYSDFIGAGANALLIQAPLSGAAALASPVVSGVGGVLPGELGDNVSAAGAWIEGQKYARAKAVETELLSAKESGLEGAGHTQAALQGAFMQGALLTQSLLPNMPSTGPQFPAPTDLGKPYTQEQTEAILADATPSTIELLKALSLGLGATGATGIVRPIVGVIPAGLYAALMSEGINDQVSDSLLKYLEDNPHITPEQLASDLDKDFRDANPQLTHQQATMALYHDNADAMALQAESERRAKTGEGMCINLDPGRKERMGALLRVNAILEQIPTADSNGITEDGSQAFSLSMEKQRLLARVQEILAYERAVKAGEMEYPACGDDHVPGSGTLTTGSDVGQTH